MSFPPTRPVGYFTPVLGISSSVGQLDCHYRLRKCHCSARLNIQLVDRDRDRFDIEGNGANGLAGVEPGDWNTVWKAGLYTPLVSRIDLRENYFEHSRERNRLRTPEVWARCLVCILHLQNDFLDAEGECWHFSPAVSVLGGPSESFYVCSSLPLNQCSGWDLATPQQGISLSEIHREQLSMFLLLTFSLRKLWWPRPLLGPGKNGGMSGCGPEF